MTQTTLEPASPGSSVRGLPAESVAAQAGYPRLLGTTMMQLEALRELDALPLSETQRQPWIDILADVRYLFDEEPDLSPEEKTVMTELRKRWEREKADLRAEGRVEGRAEGRAESILTH